MRLRILTHIGLGYLDVIRSALPEENVEWSHSNGRDDFKFLIEAVKPDLVLIDCVLPDAGGLEFYRWYRDTSPIVPRPCLLLVTPSTERRLLKEVHKAPWAAIGIPIERKTLEEAFDKLLQARVELPPAPDPAGATALPHESTPVVQEVTHVMVVEDNENHRWMTCSVLESAGYRASACPSIDALKAAILERPDLILMDVHMPVLGGLALAELLKTCKLTRNIPVLFLSGVYDAETVRAAQSLQPAAFLTKPIRGSELLRVINQVLRGIPVTQSGRFGTPQEIAGPDPRSTA